MQLKTIGSVCLAQHTAWSAPTTMNAAAATRSWCYSSIPAGKSALTDTLITQEFARDAPLHARPALGSQPINVNPASLSPSFITVAV